MLIRKKMTGKLSGWKSGIGFDDTQAFTGAKEQNAL